MCRCRSCRKCCAPRCACSPTSIARTGSSSGSTLELEQRVAERTAELEASTHAAAGKRAAAQPCARGRQHGLVGLGPRHRQDRYGTKGQHAIYGVDPGHFAVTPENFKVLIVPEDWERLQVGMQSLLERGEPHQAEFRVRRPNGEVRWCVEHGGGAASTPPARSPASAASRWTSPSARRPRSARRMLAREVDHRAKNAMAIVQSIVRLTKAANIDELRLDHRRAHQGALARACAALELALAGRRPRKPRARGACALPLDPAGPADDLRAQGDAGADHSRKRSRSRCMSLPPMRRNTARSPPRRASSACAGSIRATR